ncbi:ABC transporter substrate-binding protein [Actinopolymorpha alba]|uniref:ABC transporter substrate-binding protein n=1 Tax=Actinopolymorpha alba TaxID=533267 RepID=UPI00036DFDDC|nr:ABC transporter substrate-binding protein [Actinopolymorpha alba]
MFRRAALIRSSYSLASAALAGLLLVACGGGGEGETTQRGSATSESKRAKLVTIAVPGDEGTLTPYTQNTGYPGANLVALVYDKLLELDEKNEPQPLLAKSIEASPDNTEFTLTLRGGVTWHDGKPFTADDVVFSAGYYREHPVADSAPQLEAVKSVTPDGDKVTFTLNSADPEFPKRLLADMRIIPKHLWSSISDPETATAEQAIGTGPYKLTSYKKDQGYELSANADYAMGKPKIDTVKVAIIPQPQTALAGLRTGEVSIWSGSVPEEQAAGLEKQRNVKVVRGPGFTSTLLAFNNQRAPFDNPKVRQAISAAIDVDRLVKTVLQGRAAPGSAGFWHPDAPGGQAVDHVYDAAQAKALLDEVGAKPGAGGIRTLAGKPMKFTLLVQSSSPQRIRAAELIRDMLKEVGIEVSVASMDGDSVDAKVWPGYDVARGRDYDLTMWGWSAPVMLDTTSLGSLVDSDTKLGRLNITGTKDAELDTLADQVREATTMDARFDLLGKLQQQIAEQKPFVTLYYPEGVYAYRQDVFDGWVYQDGAGVLNKMSYVDLVS